MAAGGEGGESGLSAEKGKADQTKQDLEGCGEGFGIYS